MEESESVDGIVFSERIGNFRFLKAYKDHKEFLKRIWGVKVY